MYLYKWLLRSQVQESFESFLVYLSSSVVCNLGNSFFKALVST